MMWSKTRTLFCSTAVLSGILGISILIIAQTSTKPIVRFTATTENVATTGQAVRIELFAWSSEAERDQFVKAWTSPVQPTVVAEAPAGRGNGRGNRGGAPAAPPANPAAQADAGARGDATAAAADPQAAPAGRGGRGARGGGRGGRGARGGGYDDAPPPPPPPMTPTTSLAAALQKAPSVGMLWTSETVGYSIRYAYRLPQTDGTERIILATDRRLGAWNSFWKPTGSAALTEYPFSVIELRLSAAGTGEGKASLASPIAVDDGSKSIGLENYASLPVILKSVKRQSVK